MMKNLVSVLGILTVAIACFAHKKDPDYLKARRDGGDLRMILSAVDDYGSAVSNASVKVLMGMNFRENAYYINGTTDADGHFAIEGRTTGNEIEIEVVKEGYYRGHKKLCFIAMGNECEVKRGRWQPWGRKWKIF